MFKVAVLGAGAQAQGIAYYLAKDKRVTKFVCFDIDSNKLWAIKKYLGNKGEVVHLDATDNKKLLIALRDGGFDGVMNALPYHLLAQTTHTTIMAGLPGVDLGQATEEQEYLRATAETMNVCHSRGEGIAPGFISKVGFSGKMELDECWEIHKYAGGILQNPKGKLGHASPFSVPGLEYEYTDKPCAIINGKPAKCAALTPDKPQVFFVNGKIIKTESAMTGKVFENDIKLWGNTQNVTYATLRHAGFDHFKKVREAFAKLNTREDRIDWLWRNLVPIEGERDMLIWRVYVIGIKEGVKTTIVYESVCLHNEKIKLSAMQQYTAAPAVETMLQMLLFPEKWPKGFPYPERHFNMELGKKNLYRHGFIIKKIIVPDFS